MRTVLTFIFLLFQLGLATPAMADDPGRAALFIDAVRTNGCAMTEAEAEATLPDTGLQMAEVAGFVEVLIQQDLVAYSLDFQRLLLDEELCAAPAEDDAAVYLAALEAFDPEAAFQPRFVMDVGMLRDYDPEYLPAMVMAYASENGCTIDLTDRDAAVQSIVSYLAGIWVDIYGAEKNLRSGVEAELTAMIGAELDAPTDWFIVEPARLVLEGC